MHVVEKCHEQLRNNKEYWEEFIIHGRPWCVYCVKGFCAYHNIIGNIFQVLFLLFGFIILYVFWFVWHNKLLTAKLEVYIDLEK